MSENHDTETATVDDGEELDPREAAELLEQTTRRAQRQFDIRPPLLMLTGVVVVLIAYGALWLSVRHQHPYAGPTGTALAVLYSTLAVWIVLVTTVMRRATSGVERAGGAPAAARGPHVHPDLDLRCTCSRGRSTMPARALRSSTASTRRRRR